MKKAFWIISLTILCSCQNNNNISQKTANNKDTTPATKTAESLYKYNTYSNRRYEYYLEYPTLLLNPQEESTNGDGRVFTDESGNDVLRVFGRRNEDAEGNLKPLVQEYKDQVRYLTGKDATNKLAISYQKSGKVFFVISGIQNDKIYYQKTIQKEDAFATAILKYDLKDTATYNKISTSIFQSFQFIKDDSTGKYYPNSY